MIRTFYTRSFYSAFIAFFILLVMSVYASAHITSLIHTWRQSQVDSASENISSFIEVRINRYKLDYYGLMKTLQFIYDDSPTRLNTLLLEEDAVESFGRLRDLALIDLQETDDPVRVVQNPVSSFNYRPLYEKEILTPEFITHKNVAFNENRPVFYGGGQRSFEKSLLAIIPISKADETILLIDIPYSEIFHPILHANLFQSTGKLVMNVYEIDAKRTHFVLSSEESVRLDSYVAKKSSLDVASSDVPFDGASLRLIFSLVPDSEFTPLVYRLPFIVLIFGALMSVLVFSIILFTGISIEKDELLRKFTSKEN